MFPQSLTMAHRRHFHKYRLGGQNSGLAHVQMLRLRYIFLLGATVPLRVEKRASPFTDTIQRQESPR